ncbi:MAG TPA: hypothetical protein PLK94_05315 [Alphaproteobacteria bacterium]|nr:hypothetical protein [Alphaproteobacteria bacterium]
MSNMRTDPIAIEKAKVLEGFDRLACKLIEFDEQTQGSGHSLLLRDSFNREAKKLGIEKREEDLNICTAIHNILKAISEDHWLNWYGAKYDGATSHEKLQNAFKAARTLIDENFDGFPREEAAQRRFEKAAEMMMRLDI